MLQVFRNSAKGSIGKIIVGLIVITFVLFGAESIISIAGNSSPATVNGDDISSTKFQRQLDARQQELAEQYGAEIAAQLANSSELSREVLNTLINQVIQAQFTSNLGFEVSDDQILESLANVSAFQVDGKFNQDQYQYVLAANGYSHSSFMAEQKAQASLSQMKSGIVNSAFSLEKSVQTYADLLAQQREVSYLKLDANEYLAEVTISSDEIETYYLEHETDFLSEEQIDVNYLKIELAALAKQIIVTDDELQSAYESYVANRKEQTTLEISHILFSDGDDLEAQALAALSRLSAGESFSDLAKELSDDPGSAEFGGSLGELLPDIYVTDFYKAASNLTTVGQVSDPVQTEYGVHLIQLDAINSPNIASFEDEKVELLAKLQLDKAKDEMLSVETDLADLAFTSDSIQEVADTFQTELLNSGWLARTSNNSLLNDADVVEAVFSSQVIDDGLMSEVVKTESGDLIVVQKKDYKPESTKALEDVSEAIVAALKSQKANELMELAIEEMLQQPLNSEDAWSTPEVVSRQDYKDIPSAIVEKAFELAKPQVEGYSLGKVIDTDSAYIVAVHRVVDAAPTDEQLLLAENFSQQMMGSVEYQVLFNTIRNQAKIKIR